MFKVKKAERKQAKLRLGLIGPSGGGKTWSSLLMAKGMGSRVIVIDTEQDSSTLYAGLPGMPEFETINLEHPYTPQRYTAALQAAIAAGADVVIIDSLSHVWQGQGGVLDKKSALDERGKNAFGNWRQPKGEHQRLIDFILQAPVHVIATIRAKQGYVQDEESRSVKKLGMDPIAEPGLEYNLTTVFDVAMDHNAKVSKDRTGLFDGKIFKITEATGKEFIEWLSSAKPEEVALPPQATEWDTAPASLRTVETAEPAAAPMTCDKCAAELRMHATGVGYLCPNSGARDDGHTRIAMADYEKRKEQYLTKQPQETA